MVVCRSPQTKKHQPPLIKGKIAPSKLKKPKHPLQNSGSEDLNLIYCDVHKGSVNVSIQENNYKLLSHWYRTPVLLHKFNFSNPDHCHCAVDTILHIWWDCPLLKPFSVGVHNTIAHVMTHTLELTPAQFLIYHSTPRGYFKSLAMHVVNSAKMCISAHWGSTQASSLSDWLGRINKIAEMEELLSTANDAPSKYINMWASWTHFQTTSEFSQLLNTL